MKGPYGRGKFDVRRVWECPRCKARKFTHGRVVHLACVCSPDADHPHWMSVVEEPPIRPIPPVPMEPAALAPAPPSESDPGPII